MPTKVTAYACSFRCGRSVITKRDGMLQHEARCFHNPVMMACQTCALNDKEDGAFFCSGDHLERGQKFASNCQHWESRTGDERCPKCHGEPNPENRLITGCLDCDFHGTLDGYKQMRKLEAEDMAAMDEALREQTEEIQF